MRTEQAIVYPSGDAWFFASPDGGVVSWPLPSEDDAHTAARARFGLATRISTVATPAWAAPPTPASEVAAVDSAEPADADHEPSPLEDLSHDALVHRAKAAGHPRPHNTKRAALIAWLAEAEQ